MVKFSLSDEPQLNSYEAFMEPGATHEITIKGSEIQVTYGAFDSLSLVGTKFILGPTDNPQKAVDVCQDRSAGGAGFQYTGFEFIEQGKMWTSNQAAGNSPGYQWGFHSEVDYYQSDTLAHIKGAEWLPAYYDAFNGNVGDPVAGESEFLYHLKRYVLARQEKDNNGEKIANFSFITKCKWKADTSLHSSQKTDAFYFGRKVARDHDMQVFIQGIDDMTKEKWYVGPIKLYEMWEENDIKDKDGIKRGAMAPVTHLNGTSSILDNSVHKVAFVMTIDSQRVAIGHELPGKMEIAIRLERSVYGYDPNNYRNGNIWYQIRYPRQNSPDFSKGEVTHQQIDMKVGTASQLESLDYWVQGDPAGIVKNSENTPYKFKLYNNYPNPFNAVTNIEYTISKKSEVKITIFNIRGQKVKELVNKKQNIGKYLAQWNGTDSQGQEVAGGVYLYRLKTKSFAATKKLLLLK